MFDSIGFPELAIIVVVAILVVGPKDLPLLMRRAGQWVKKLRGMADDFRANFDDLARQAELDELRKEVEALKAMRPLQEIEDELQKPLAAGVDPSGRIDLTTGQPVGQITVPEPPVVAASTPSASDPGVLIDPPAEAPPKKTRARKAAAADAVPETVDPARRKLVEAATDVVPRKPRTRKTPPLAGAAG